MRGIPDDYLPAGRGRAVLTNIAFAQLDGNGIGVAAGNPHEGSDRRFVAVDVVRSLVRSSSSSSERASGPKRPTEAS